MFVDAVLLSVNYRRGVGGRHSEPAYSTVARGSSQGWHHAAGTVHILFIVCTVQYSKLILYGMSPPATSNEMMFWFGNRSHLSSRVHSNAPYIWSHRGTKGV